MGAEPPRTPLCVSPGVEAAHVLRPPMCCGFALHPSAAFVCSSQSPHCHAFVNCRSRPTLSTSPPPPHPPPYSLCLIASCGDCRLYVPPTPPPLPHTHCAPPCRQPCKANATSDSAFSVSPHQLSCSSPIHHHLQAPPNEAIGTPHTPQQPAHSSTLRSRRKRFTFRGDHHEPKKQSHACAHKGYGVV